MAEMRRLTQQGDLTSANIRYRQMKEELEGVSQPIWLGRRRTLLRRPYRMIQAAGRGVME